MRSAPSTFVNRLDDPPYAHPPAHERPGRGKHQTAESCAWCGALVHLHTGDVAIGVTLSLETGWLGSLYSRIA